MKSILLLFVLTVCSPPAISQDAPATAAKTNAPATPQKQPIRIREGPSVAAAQLVHRVAPSYQYLEPGTKLKGTVRLHAIIAEDGSVEQLQVISGHPLVVNAVMDAVKQWKYRPTLLNGEPVQVDTMIDVDYKIDIKKLGKS